MKIRSGIHMQERVMESYRIYKECMCNKMADLAIRDEQIHNALTL